MTMKRIFGRAASLVLAFGLAASLARAATTRPHVDTSGANAQPAYPATALPDREAGAAILAVEVDAKGAVEKVSPVKTSGFDDLDAAAIAAAMGWKFVPATKDGRPVEGSTLVQVVFQPPPDKSGQSVKAGVQADYLSSGFTLEAAEGNDAQMRKPLPCSNGSLSVAMRFDSVNNAPHSIAGNSNLAVTIGDGKQIALVDTFPAYYPAHWQYVVLDTLDRSGLVGQLDTAEFRHDTRQFRIKAQFRAPTIVTLSWNPTGIVTAEVGGQKLRAQLPAMPTAFGFLVTEAVGRFINARVICTRE